MEFALSAKLRDWIIVLLLFISVNTHSQNTFFDQNFSGGGPYESGSPGTSLFDKILSTDPQSFAEYGAGYMDLVRTGSGGLIRAIRSTAFNPPPATMYAQITMSVEEILSAGANAAYFYVGNGFRTDNSSIVPNDNLFARFSITFNDNNTFVVRDLQTNTNSSPMAVGTVFTITWVMNNSNEGHVYKMPETASTPDYKVMPGHYDIWIDNNRFVTGATAYPGNSVKFDPNQLNNFEVKFWNALGRIRFYNFKFRDIAGILPLPINESNPDPSPVTSYAIVNPNPASPTEIRLSFAGDVPVDIKLFTAGGVIINNFVRRESDHLFIFPLSGSLPAGLYILTLSQGNIQVVKKVLIK
jgi:hypothetical protein